MSTLTESTALRLLAAMERLANAMERSQALPPPSTEHLPPDVAGVIVGGVEALKALNKRQRASRRKSTSRSGQGRMGA